MTSVSNCRQNISTDTPHFHKSAKRKDFVPKHAAQNFGVGIADYRSVARHSLVGHVCFKRHYAEFILIWQTQAINCYFDFLFSMKNVHPPDGFSITDLAQIDLSGLQVLMPQNNFGDNLQRHSISAGVCG